MNNQSKEVGNQPKMDTRPSLFERVRSSASSLVSSVKSFVSRSLSRMKRQKEGTSQNSEPKKNNEKFASKKV